MSWTAVVYGNVVRIACWRRWFRAVMLSAVALSAQSGDWAQVQALAPGAHVEVKRFSGGGQVNGVVESVSGERLVVARKSDSVAMDRVDVRRLRLRSNEKSKRGRITGTAILGGLGVMSAMVSDKARDGSGLGRAATVPISGGIGYLIGWAADGPKRITLYEARKP